MKYKFTLHTSFLCLYTFFHISAIDFHLEKNSIIENLKRPEFIKEELPINFDSIIELLQKGVTAQQPPAYACSVFMMFTNMIHGAEFVHSAALSKCIKDMSELMPHYLTPRKMKSESNKQILIDICDTTQIKEHTYNLMYNKFTQRYDEFRQTPTQFLDKIAQEMADLTQENIDIIRLHHELRRFLEISISKIVWSPQRPETMWRSVRELSQHLGQLAKDNIIKDIADLDTLYWTLTRRLCFFIDLTTYDMPITFLQEVRSEIHAQPPLFLKLEEQEQYIETKQACVIRYLIEAEAKKRAHEAGIIPRS